MSGAKRKVTHYCEQRFTISACGDYMGHKAKITNDKDRVTCLRCNKKVGA